MKKLKAFLRVTNCSGRNKMARKMTKKTFNLETPGNKYSNLNFTGVYFFVILKIKDSWWLKGLFTSTIS